MRFLVAIRGDWRMMVAVILVLLMAAVFIFNLTSSLPSEKPVIGVFTYGLIPFFFILGALNFILVIVKPK
jgi:hypothetical protein